jgi:phospholipid/cholesterol/gamma-HCH transport system ATP-binding protein
MVFNVNQEKQQPIIEIKNLGTCFDGVWVHKNLNLTIYPNRIVNIIGASGSGKTTLVHEILMLQPITEGEIFLVLKYLNLTLNNQQLKKF